MTPNRTTAITAPGWLSKLRFSKKNLKRVTYAVLGHKLPITFFNRYHSVCGGWIAYIAYKKTNSNPKIINLAFSRPSLKSLPNHERWEVFIHELAHAYDTIYQEYNWFNDRGESDHSHRYTTAINAVEEELKRLDIGKLFCYTGVTGN